MQNLDQHGMREALLGFHRHIREGYKLGSEIKFDGNLDNIIICGMGGSGLGGRVLKSYLYNSGKPIFVINDYQLPKYATEKSLVFFVSYSGGTEEVLESFKSKSFPMSVVIANSGELMNLAQSRGIKSIRMPKCHQPRFSYCYQFLAILRVLANCGLISKHDDMMEKLADSIRSGDFESKGKELAKDLYAKVPLIYTSTRLDAVGYKWKINFNENSKIQAFSSVFPENNHNEINGFENRNGNFHAIFIKDCQDHPMVQKRMDVINKLISERGVFTTTIETQGESYLERLISTIYLGDWTSYYLALEYETDPTPVDIVQELKSKLTSV